MISYRTGSLEMFHTIAQLREDLFHDHASKSTFPALYTPDRLIASNADLLSRDHVNLSLAACVKKSVGFCLASCHKMQGEINALYVAPEYRKQGIGKILFAMSLSWVQSLKPHHIKIDIIEGNNGMIPFYQSYGFELYYHTLHFKGQNQ